MLLARWEEADEEEAGEGERHNEHNGYGLTELIDKGCADRENFRNEEYYINSSRLLLKRKYLLILKNGQGQTTIAGLACERQENENQRDADVQQSDFLLFFLEANPFLLKCHNKCRRHNHD